MNNEKKTNEASEFIERVAEFIAYPDEEEDMHSLRHELINGGLDPDRAIKRVQSFVEEKRRERRLAWQETASKKQKEIQDRLMKAMERIKGTPKELMQKIQEAAGVKGALVFARKLNSDEMGEEELRSLLAAIESADEHDEKGNGAGRESDQLE